MDFQTDYHFVAPVFFYSFNLSLEVSALGRYLSSLYFPGGLQNTISMSTADGLHRAQMKQERAS